MEKEIEEISKDILKEIVQNLLDFHNDNDCGNFIFSKNKNEEEKNIIGNESFRMVTSTPKKTTSELVCDSIFFEKESRFNISNSSILNKSEEKNEYLNKTIDEAIEKYENENDNYKEAFV
ncbi:hypothetical protein Phum_PHUM197610 [Pediculus humanus corporis]|uniref:Uncharacterized protein n=1 Tax=Pediculus humanus subsp. corporis TaxID=121224 RepID=E0VH21_PEDHC|nr:uncharacterized protein Phum_PHUM197610 [Pediculus humanus corporis]EEB12677.1 hypothetical protein Phum_PHUM197610 [Pediculus humanus corporis]